MSYQDWANYPTWCIHLWISNEEGLYRAWRDEARTSWDETAPLCEGPDVEPHSHKKCLKERKDAAKYDLADKLKDSWEYQASEDTTNEGFWSDLQSWALAQVDWHEVAAALLEDLDG